MSVAGMRLSAVPQAQLDKETGEYSFHNLQFNFLFSYPQLRIIVDGFVFSVSR